MYMGALCGPVGQPATRGPCTASLPDCSLRRQTSEVGTVCGNAASTGLCGGRSVMVVPTVTRVGTHADARCLSAKKRRESLGAARRSACATLFRRNFQFAKD